MNDASERAPVEFTLGCARIAALTLRKSHGASTSRRPRLGSGRWLLTGLTLIPEAFQSLPKCNQTSVLRQNNVVLQSYVAK
jgi:hypothetical protein